MKTYKIKRFCQHMGVSLDTVKHYQSCGILSPIIDTENNYRYYNITHGERLIVSRKFRNLGFSIEDTTALISSKNGFEIQDMLTKRNEEISQTLEQLQDNYQNISYLIELCDLFNHKVNTFSVCQRPAYYIYRHTYNFEFINEDMSESLTKELMDQLPNAVKMLILPHSSLKARKNYGFYHSIALKESLSSKFCSSHLEAMEYFPEATCVRFIYSRPHSKEKIAILDDIYQEIAAKGYTLNQEDILIENAIDYYQDGFRYENYLIYYPLS